MTINQFPSTHLGALLPLNLPNFSTNPALLLKDYPLDPGPVGRTSRISGSFSTRPAKGERIGDRLKSRRGCEGPSVLVREAGTQSRAIARIFQAELVEGSRAEHTGERADYRTRTHARGTQHGNRGRT